MSSKPVFILVRQGGTIPTDLQRIQSPVLPPRHPRVPLQIHCACRHHVLQRLNGKTTAIGEFQALQVRRKHWSLSLWADFGEDVECSVVETGTVYEMQLGTEEALFVEWVTGSEMRLVVSLEN